MTQLSQPAKTNIIIGLLITSLLVALCICGSVFLPGLGNAYLSPTVLFIISRLLFWLMLVLVYLYCSKIEHQPILIWADRHYGILFYFISCVLVLVAVVAGSIIIQLIAHVFKWSSQAKAAKDMGAFNIPIKLLIVLTAAVVEEFIFRGYLMPRLHLFFKNALWPVLISALLFGLAHFRYGTFVNVAGPLWIGLVFAWYYQKYKNIRPLIICHFLIDFAALFLIRQ